MDEFIGILQGDLAVIKTELALLIIIAGLIFGLIIAILHKFGVLRKKSRWSFFAYLLILPLFIISFKTLLIIQLDSVKHWELIQQVDKIGDSIILLLISWLIVQALDIFVWRGFFFHRKGIEVTGILIGLVATAVYIVAFFVIVSFVFERPMTGLIVSSGVVAGVIGLSIQSSLADFFAGIAISIERPFRINDWIEMEDGPLGKVVDINWRATHILSWNNSLYIIPNSKASNSIIHNYHMPNKVYGYWFFVQIPSSVSPILVRQVLLEAALSSDKVLKTPVPVIRVSEAGWTYKYMVFIHFCDFQSYFAGMDDLLVQTWIHCARAGITPTAVSQEVIMHRGKRSEAQELDPGEFLAGVEIFHDLSSNERLRLLGGSIVHHYTSGQSIVEQGRSGDSLYIIMAGMTCITINMENSDPLEVAKLGIGQYFGEMSLLAGDPRSANVMAYTDCQVIEIDKNSIDPILKERPELIEKFAQIIAEKNFKNQVKMEATSTKSTSDQLSEMVQQITRKIRSVFS